MEEVRLAWFTFVYGAYKFSESVTTPPPPSSSPGPGNDSMEISPLPHKAPYQSIMQIQPQSPTPEATPSEDVTMACTEIVPQPPVETSRPTYMEYVSTWGSMQTELTRVQIDEDDLHY